MSTQIPLRKVSRKDRTAIYRPPSRAAAHIARKYRLLPHMAETIARLAGLGGNREGLL